MDSENVKIVGKGEVKESDDAKDCYEEGLQLPPLPDNSVEYTPVKSEEIKDNTIELASPTIQTFSVSDVDDPTNLGDISEAIIEEKPKEFVPNIQDARIDSENEGGAQAARISGPTGLEAKAVKLDEAIQLLGGKKSNFNPGTIQNALEDQKIEGGVISNRSTGPMTNDGDASKEGFQIKEIKPEEVKNKFRVYGFTVQFKENDLTVTQNISDYFDDIEDAFTSVNRTKYLMTIDGGYRAANIISGIPEISHLDQRLYKHINGSWRKM